MASNTQLANVRDPSVSISITGANKKQDEEDDDQRRKRRAGFFWWCCCAGFVVIICIAVGVGVGVGTQDTENGTRSTNAPTNAGGGGGGGSPTSPPTSLASRTFSASEETSFFLGSFNRGKVADMDGDGKDDIIVLTKGNPASPGGSHDSALTVLRHSQTNNVTYVKRCETTCTPTEDFNAIKTASPAAQRAAFNDINIGDLDGDGKLDILVTNGGSNTTGFWKNTGSPDSPSFVFTTFGGGSIILVNTATSTFNGAALADFNGDGKLDIVYGGDVTTASVTNDLELRVHLQSDSINGTFLPHVVLQAFNGATNVFEITTGDVDEDDNFDVIMAKESGLGTYTVTVFRGNGDGNFQAGVNVLTTTSTFSSVQLANMNADNHLDLVVGYGNRTVTVYFGDGNGAFPTFRSISVGSAGCGLVRAQPIDFDLDGTIDVLVGLENGLNPCSPIGSSILTNDGTGTLSVAKSFGPGSPAAGDVLGGDFNGDGKNDLISFARPSTLTSVLV